MHQRAEALLALAELALGVALPADVPPAAAVAAEAALGVEERHAAELRDPAPALGVPEGEGEVAERAVGVEIGQVRLPVVVLGIVEPPRGSRGPEDGLGHEAGHGLEAVGEPDEAVRLVGLPEPVGGGLGEVLEAALLLGPCRRRAQRLGDVVGDADDPPDPASRVDAGAVEDLEGSVG